MQIFNLLPIKMKPSILTFLNVLNGFFLMRSLVERVTGGVEHLPAKVRDEGPESRSTIALHVQAGLLGAANTKPLIAHDLSVMGRKKRKTKDSVAVFQVKHIT